MAIDDRPPAAPELIELAKALARMDAERDLTPPRFTKEMAERGRHVAGEKVLREASPRASGNHAEEKVERDEEFFSNALVRKGGKTVRDATGTLARGRRNDQ